MPVDEPQSEPEPLAAEEVERLIALAEQGQLEAADQQRIAPLLRTLLWLEHALLETRISLATLKRLLFGKPTEKTPRKPPAEPPEAPADAASDNGAEAASTTEPANDTQDATADGETPNETPAPSPPSRQRHPARQAMVGWERRTIPAPRSSAVRTITCIPATSARPARVVACTPCHPWCACAFAASPWWR